MTCKPTTFAQVYADGAIKSGSLNAEAGLLNFTDLLLQQANPTAGFDRGALLSSAGNLTRTLRNIDIGNGDYPFLNQRFQQSPILYTEVADFLQQSSIDIDDFDADIAQFQEFIKGPVTLPVSPANTALGSGTTGINNILSQLEFYYAQNLANSISAGFCGSFGNVFGKINQLIALIQLGESLLDKLKSFDLTYLIKQIKEKLKLEILKEMLLKIVDKVKDAILGQIEGVVTQFTNFANNIQSNVEQIGQAIQKKMNDVKAFMQDFTLDKLKDKIKEFIDKSVAQFEDLTPDAIALLLFRFCQFSELIQGFMKSPLDGIKTFVAGVIAQEAILKSMGLEETSKAVQAGAPRLDETARRNGRKVLRDANNRKSTERDSSGPPPPAPDPEFWATSTEITSKQRSAIAGMSDKGLPGYATWNSGVINMHSRFPSVTDCVAGDGWRQVRNKVYAGLMRMGDRLETEFNINSAYRSPQYNAELAKKSGGVAKNSTHKSGLALDVNMRGKSDDEVRNFIRVASQEGFVGMKVYFSGGVNFIHIDMRDGANVSWGDSGKFQSYINAHKRGDFTNGPKAPQAPTETPSPHSDPTSESAGGNKIQGAPVPDDFPVSDSDIAPGDSFVSYSTDPKTGEYNSYTVTRDFTDADGFTGTETVRIPIE